eukprot:2037590-Rhodomonas_salina.1
MGFEKLTCRLQLLGNHTEELLPGQNVSASVDSWATGDIAPKPLRKKGCAYGVWTCGEGYEYACKRDSTSA